MRARTDARQVGVVQVQPGVAAVSGRTGKARQGIVIVAGIREEVDGKSEPVAGLVVQYRERKASGDFARMYACYGGRMHL